MERGRGRRCTNAFSSPAGKKEIETAPTTLTVAWEDRTKLLNIQEQGGNIPNCFPRHICNTPVPSLWGRMQKPPSGIGKRKRRKKGREKLSEKLASRRLKRISDIAKAEKGRRHAKLLIIKSCEGCLGNFPPRLMDDLQSRYRYFFGKKFRAKGHCSWKREKAVGEAHYVP